uniref:(California timema) hypothetical protein n=1 Tax=Timema californicum TaxID=61474 RepID=A0A7R9JAL4_TIMCA|nr:unnamed protein product [Timema californicum]
MTRLHCYEKPGHQYDHALNLASQTVLDTLTDVADSLLNKFAVALHNAFERERLRGPTGFPDIVERVFHEMGLGSILNLHDFYQTRIIHYHNFLKEGCISKTQSYIGQLKVYKSLRAGEKLTTMAEAEEQDGNVPEIHFPAQADDSVVDQLQPSLETGFQMLHSLEQEQFGVVGGAISLSPEKVRLVASVEGLRYPPLCSGGGLCMLLWWSEDRLQLRGIVSQPVPLYALLWFVGTIRLPPQQLARAVCPEF